MSVELLAASVPANVREVCAVLVHAGHEAVTVGGAVRDAILGREPGDWDVATSATPDQVLKLFKHCIPTGLQHGTVTIVTGRGEESHVEVTTFRGEGAYTDARRPDHVVFGVPLVEDLARRDLVVNAMAYDPARGVLHDPFGGLDDIAHRRLRAVGPSAVAYTNAVARFTEDGLRVMRAVRFAAVLEFALDPETERGIAEPAVLASLRKVSRERVSDELRKLLAAPRPSVGLAIAERTGIVREILPELGALAIGDRDRWLAAIDAAPAAARLGALIAPLAQPDARIVKAVVERADKILRALKFSNDESGVASKLAGVAAATADGDPAIRRLLADVGRAVAPVAVELWRAEQLPIAARARVARRPARARRAGDRRQGSDRRARPPARSAGRQAAGRAVRAGSARSGGQHASSSARRGGRASMIKTWIAVLACAGCGSPSATAPLGNTAPRSSARPHAPRHVLHPTAGDRDGDGILDDVDLCPDDPEDFDGFQDQDGCPDPDNDNDGIPDDVDKCPNVPKNQNDINNTDGCPRTDAKDRDGDGIPDDRDKCPDDPEDFDGYQDADGCPDPDNDKDGIPDIDDLCPNDPETFNGYQDQDGCPDKRP